MKNEWLGSLNDEDYFIFTWSESIMWTKARNFKIYEVWSTISLSFVNANGIISEQENIVNVKIDEEMTNGKKI